MRVFLKSFLVFASFALLSSCGIYNKNTMFKTDGELVGDTLLHRLATLERNYIVQKNDYLSVTVYTNNGEQIVDPTGKLNETLGLSGAQTQITGQEGGGIKYLVETDGMVKLPMIGRVMLEGLTISQADSVLEVHYGKYYNDAFVYTRILNKRVVVLGAGGGMMMGGAGMGALVRGVIIDLDNENMNLVEVLAKAGGVDQLGRVSNIRIIRGDLKNPNVYLIDLTTIEGMKKANLNVQPNDIIYIERYKKVVTQTLSEISSLTGMITAIANTVLIFVLLRN